MSVYLRNKVLFDDIAKLPRKFHVTRSGAIRDENDRCPLCSLANYRDPSYTGCTTWNSAADLLEMNWNDAYLTISAADNVKGDPEIEDCRIDLESLIKLDTSYLDKSLN